ncbi:MAG TPA: L,D-transpeptidase family protein [Stellaceae bacterium]|nr:L,D-transpeptidase family protein [Stellaceae bacterium]
MDLVVHRDGRAFWNGREMRAALGKGGISREKHEGDHATPAGLFLLREVLYRPDRLRAPRTSLPLRPLSLADGWCDAPEDPRYNRRVTLPYAASAEELWRGDRLYDVIVPLGYNDDPVVPGRGSAIFLHVARPDYGGTEGCVALSLEDLIAVLAEATDRSCVSVRE